MVITLSDAVRQVEKVANEKRARINTKLCLLHQPQ